MGIRSWCFSHIMNILKKKLHLTMAKIMNFLLYKLYFNKKKSPYLSSSCFTPPHPKPHWIQLTQHPMSLLILLPCFLPWSLSVPPSQKKSYPSFRICSKFVMILISHSNCHNSSKFYIVEVGSYWEALGYPV